MAKDLKMDRKTVIKAIKTLTWYGLIDVEKRERDPKTKRFKRTIYAINPIETSPRPDKPPRTKRSQRPRYRQTVRGIKPRRKKPTQVPLNGQTQVPLNGQTQVPSDGTVTPIIKLIQKELVQPEVEKSTSGVPSFFDENGKDMAAGMEVSTENGGESRPSFKGKRRSRVERWQDSPKPPPSRKGVTVSKSDREALATEIVAKVLCLGKPINRCHVTTMMPRVLTPERVGAIRELLARGPIEIDDYLCYVAEIIKTYPVPGSC